MRQFVKHRRIIVRLVGEAFPRRHLNVISSRAVKGSIPAVANVSTGVLEECLGCLDNLKWFPGLDMYRRDSVNLLSVEDGIDAVNEAAALLFVISAIILAAGLCLPKFNPGGLLALADLPSLIGRLFVSYPARIAV